MKKLILFFAVLICFLQVSLSQNRSSDSFKTRIGMNFGGGSGSKFVPIITLTDGSEASISFGGGIVVGLKIGYELGKHFDLGLDIGGQFGELDKSVSNASMTFTRTSMSLTPSYILLIKGGEKMRLKLGAGLDMIYGTQLDFDLSEIEGGVKDIWKYKRAFGEHLSMIFEYNINSRFSFSVGIRMAFAKYEFESGGLSYPDTDDLAKPNGSGTDALFSACYHFNWKKKR